MARRSRLALAFLLAVALALHGAVALVLIAALDMGLSILDDSIDVLTARAIAAVMHTRTASGELASVVAARFGSVSWSAAHTDDDCLYSIQVTAVIQPNQPWYQQAHWCVRLRSTGLGPIGSLRIAEVVPGNDVAARLSPNLASRIAPPSGGPWACSIFYLHPVH